MLGDMTQFSIRPFRFYCFLSILLWASWPALPVYSQGDAGNSDAVETAPPVDGKSAAPSTVADPKIPIENLRVKLRPLTEEELESETSAWMALVKAKIIEVGETELKINAIDTASDPEIDGEALTETLVRQRTEETDLIRRARVVIAALKAKGGDTKSAESYLEAVTDLSPTMDVTSRRAAMVGSVKGWLRSPEGGLIWGKRFLTALIVMFLFWLVSRVAGRVTSRVLSRQSQTSDLMTNFARRTAGGVVFLVGILTALSIMGLEVGPMMAALGAGGFIIAFALQETMASFASGLMIMVYQPFDVDDFVSVAGVSGKVKAMSLVSTTMITVDNKALIIPNKMAWGDIITNYTKQDKRRVDLIFGIGYEDDIQKATDVLIELASAYPQVLQDPKPDVRVAELADSSVNLFCRPWVKTEDYWDVYWGLMRQVKERFDAEGISIPYPQRDVHLHQVEDA
jgi:small conductance mechanosensitive channel